MTTDFEANVAAFEARLPELLRSSPGQFAVVAAGRVIAVLDSENAALSVGYERIRTGQFLVQKIAPVRELCDFHARATACPP